MLAQLAARLRARQGGGGDDAGGGGGVVVGEDGETIMIDDNCTVSVFIFSVFDSNCSLSARSCEHKVGDGQVSFW